MAGKLSIFSIYKLRDEDKYYLLRTEQPGFSNTDQGQQDSAEKTEQNKREHILTLIGKTHNSQTGFDFIGEFQGLPIGDRLYTAHRGSELNIYYMDTAAGPSWIIIGNTDSETDFLTGLNEDDDLLQLKPLGKPRHITATFVTEDDFGLSGIDGFDKKDIRPE
ncbi:hypothetical protein ACTHGU_05655 [Chitinophagaceae bacterium MMS25-I14]